MARPSRQKKSVPFLLLSGCIVFIQVCIDFRFKNFQQLNHARNNYTSNQKRHGISLGSDWNKCQSNKPPPSPYHQGLPITPRSQRLHKSNAYMTSTWTPRIRPLNTLNWKRYIWAKSLPIPVWQCNITPVDNYSNLLAVTCAFQLTKEHMENT